MTAPIIVLISPAEDVLDAPRIQSGVLKALSDSANFLAIAPFRAGDKALAGETGKIVDQVRPLGAILAPAVSADGALRAALREVSCPAVSIAPIARSEPSRVICSNDRLGACDAANYLVALGHKRIGFIALADDSPVARERELGFLEALNGHGMASGAELIAPADDTVEAACEAALLLLEVSPRPTAILASSDRQAAGVLQAARLRDVAVPGGLSVMGFGDAQLAGALTPPLTTMRVPYAEMGFTAAVMLLDPARAGMQPVEFFCELVVRESTAPLP